jgi:uncharacterized surface protein with fasciclin (FAS1) repeats
MHPWIRRVTLAPMLVAATALSGCFLDDDEEDDTPPVVALNIVETAQADPNLSLLVEAVVAAELVTTLSSEAPKTVFAPTNAAFTALLTELGVTKEALFADKPLLTAVLTYHVLGSEVPAASVPVGLPITTLQGGYFKVDANGSALVITDGRNRTSNITTTNIDASNGVIHVVDKVLLPADKTVVETAVALASGDTPEFTLLVEALTAADLVETLSGTGPFTVFAPTDAAFAALLTELGVTKEALFADTELLTAVLTYHVVPGLVLEAGVPVGAAITTVQGATFTVAADLSITDQAGRVANITATDVLASNGVIHVIDKVILPTP